MADIAQVLRNYSINHHVSIGQAISDIAHTASGDSEETLNGGQKIVDEALKGTDDSRRCQELKKAIRAATGAERGDIPSTFEHWGGGRTTRQGVTRHGDSYFY